jgi:hypothetical protein
MKNLILMLFVVLSFYSCTDISDTNIEDCGNTTNVAYGSFSYCGALKENPKQPSFLIINSADEMQKLFTTCETFDVALPDFTQKRILGLFAGPKPTAGYAIKIQSVVEDNCQVTVEYFEKEPHKEDIVAQVITYPADYVVLPKSSKPILFKKVVEITDYVIIGRYSLYCPSNCSSSYRIDAAKTIRLSGNNIASGNFEALNVKEDLSSFVSHIPQEVLALKGQTKEYTNNMIADGGGCYFEYHQGDVMTKIDFMNFNNADPSQENLVKFMDYIYSRVAVLDGSK